MKEKQVLFYIIIGFTIITFLQNIYMVSMIEIMTPEHVTAKVALGNARMCINYPPIINFTCNTTIGWEIPYTCQVGAYDQDGDDFYFNLSFITPHELFNITPSGFINFTPLSNQSGNHTFNLKSYNLLPCYVEAFETVDISIVDSNHAPILIQPIPNQTWFEGSSLRAFDLDEYFMDPDGDPLNFTWSLPPSIAVTTDALNYITFNPIPSWYGTNTITFVATDPYGLNATSNRVYLIVNSYLNANQGGSGGSSGGGSAPACIPEWYCRAWGTCQVDNLQYRTCTDLQNCDSTLGKPNETQACNYVHTCYDGIKGPGEEGIDCGGVCPKCENCHDGIQNQGEEAIDCGGPCKPCQLAKENETYEEIYVENPAQIIEQGISFMTKLLIALMLGLILLSAAVLKGPSLYRKLLLAMKHKKKAALLKPEEKASILEKLAKLESRIPKGRTSKLLITYSTILREYFKDILSLRYEFTYQDLMKEIQASPIDKDLKLLLTEFFVKTTRFEFSGQKVSKAELQAMINEFREIIELTGGPTESDKVHDPHIIAKSKMDKIFIKISHAEEYLRTNKLNQTYDLYIEILKDFEDLPIKNQEILKDYIQRLYEELKLAREQH